MNLLDRLRADPSYTRASEWIVGLKLGDQVAVQIRDMYWDGSTSPVVVSDIVLKGAGKVFRIQGLDAHHIWLEWQVHMRYLLRRLF